MKFKREENVMKTRHEGEPKCSQQRRNQCMWALLKV